MATSAPMRRSLVDQIPTEEDRQAPAARPQSGIHASEFGRQAYNTAMALPGIGGVGKVAQTGGLVSRALNSTAGVVNKVATGTAALAVLPAGAESPESTPAIPRTSAAGAARGTVNPPTAGASNPLVDASRQVAPGIYRTGNSYAGTGEAAVSLNSDTILVRPSRHIRVTHIRIYRHYVGALLAAFCSRIRKGDLCIAGQVDPSTQPPMVLAIRVIQVEGGNVVACAVVQPKRRSTRSRRSAGPIKRRDFPNVNHTGFRGGSTPERIES